MGFSSKEVSLQNLYIPPILSPHPFSIYTPFFLYISFLTFFFFLYPYLSQSIQSLGKFHIFFFQQNKDLLKKNKSLEVNETLKIAMSALYPYMSSSTDLFQLPVTQSQVTTRIRNYLHSQHEVSIKTSDEDHCYEYLGIRSDFGPVFQHIAHGDVSIFNDEKRLYGCEAYTRQDAKEIKNKILLLSRGKCNFIDKVLHAQRAGAKAVIFLNNQQGDGFRIVGQVKESIKIPSLIIGYKDTLSLLKTRKRKVTAFEVKQLPLIDHDASAVISLLYRGERINNVVIINV